MGAREPWLVFERVNELQPDTGVGGVGGLLQTHLEHGWLQSLCEQNSSKNQEAGSLRCFTDPRSG